MIEATGIVTLVDDPNQPGVAVPDIVEQWSDEGQLYHKLLDCIGKHVYVLVLPEEEMLAKCQCGHSKADHFKLQNWDTHTYPSMDESPHVSWYSHGPCCPDKYCKCTKFTGG